MSNRLKYFLILAIIGGILSLFIIAFTAIPYFSSFNGESFAIAEGVITAGITVFTFKKEKDDGK